MIKKLLISVVTLACVNPLYASSSDSKEKNDWKIFGDLRVGYVQYNYDNPLPKSSLINKGNTDSQGTYIIPKLSLTTPVYSNFKAKVTLAGATDFGINDSKDESKNFVFDGGENQSFALLQEFFISYSDKSHNFTIGRQELVTPLVEADDYYFLANSFDAINYINSSVDNFTFHLGYFYQMAGVWDSGANGTQFHSMSDSSFVAQEDKDNADDTGIMYGAVEYKNENHKLKIWEYYIPDLYNIFLTEYNFSNKGEGFSYNSGIQFVNYKEVGELASNNYTNIDYSIFSAKFDGSFSNGISFGTAATKYTNGAGTSETLGTFGGFPSYTYGYAHSYFTMGSMRNSKIFQAKIGYDLQKIGLNGIKIEYKCNYYNLDSQYSRTASDKMQGKMRLNGIKLSYNNNGAYFKAIYELQRLDNEPNSSSVRLIGGYRF